MENKKQEIKENDLENINGGFNDSSIGDISGTLQQSKPNGGSGKEAPLGRHSNKEDELFIPPATE